MVEAIFLPVHGKETIDIASEVRWMSKLMGVLPIDGHRPADG